MVPLALDGEFFEFGQPGGEGGVGGTRYVHACCLGDVVAGLIEQAETLKGGSDTC